jgi:hypothetical protein
MTYFKGAKAQSCTHALQLGVHQMKRNDGKVHQCMWISAHFKVTSTEKKAWLYLISRFCGIDFKSNNYFFQ